MIICLPAEVFRVLGFFSSPGLLSVFEAETDGERAVVANDNKIKALRNTCSIICNITTVMHQKMYLMQFNFILKTLKSDTSRY